jgi:hypothetical protein
MDRSRSVQLVDRGIWYMDISITILMTIATSIIMASAGAAVVIATIDGIISTYPIIGETEKRTCPDGQKVDNASQCKELGVTRPCPGGIEVLATDKCTVGDYLPQCDGSNFKQECVFHGKHYCAPNSTEDWCECDEDMRDCLNAPNYKETVQGGNRNSTLITLGFVILAKRLYMRIISYQYYFPKSKKVNYARFFTCIRTVISLPRSYTFQATCLSSS